jgi:low temperature requirement protein LtrA
MPASRLDEPDEVEQRVTSLELFFDLVFVFAITQVTGYVSARPSWTRLVEGLAIPCSAVGRVGELLVAGKHGQH